jgi:hypothetical protein
LRQKDCFMKLIKGSLAGLILGGILAIVPTGALANGEHEGAHFGGRGDHFRHGDHFQYGDHFRHEGHFFFGYDHPYYGYNYPYYGYYR